MANKKDPKNPYGGTSKRKTGTSKPTKAPKIAKAQADKIGKFLDAKPTKAQANKIGKFLDAKPTKTLKPIAPAYVKKMVKAVTKKKK